MPGAKPVAGTAATIAILFIIVIALAGLGKVVVKALGGEEVKVLKAAPRKGKLLFSDITVDQTSGQVTLRATVVPRR